MPESRLNLDHILATLGSSLLTTMRIQIKSSTWRATLTAATAFVITVSFIQSATADEATLPTPASKEGVTYAKDIKPLFERSCFKCHGEEKQKAGLRLDTLAAALKGTKDEKVILPGDSAGSELVEAVARVGDDEDEWMPPEGKADPLTAEEVGLVRAWIDQGAK